MNYRPPPDLLRIAAVAGLSLATLGGALVVSPAALVDWVGSLEGGLVVLVALLCVYLVRPLFFGPMSLITVFVGYRYGLVSGFAIAMAGTVITTLPPFLLAKYFGRSVRILRGVRRTGRRAVRVTGELRGVVSARLSPAPADAVSYAAGFASIPVTKYVAGTVVGELPWATAYLLLGDSLRRLSLASLTLDIRVVAGLTLAAVLLLIRPVLRWTSGSE